MTFARAAEHTLKAYGPKWRPGTMQIAKSYLRSTILPTLGHRSIRHLTRADIRYWHATLYDRPASANRAVPIVSVILRHAAARGWRRDENLTKGLRRYKERARAEYLTDAQIARLNDLLRDTSRDVADVVRLLLLTGCRRSEIVNLDWQHVQLSEHPPRLSLPDSKAGPRTIWLASPAVDILERRRRRSGHGPVFVFHRNELDRAWHRLRNDMLLPTLRLHDLRHTYASFALGRGETLATVQRLLGHHSATVTARYARFDLTSQRSAADAIAKAIA